ncbi:MAG: hypothetical protein AAGB19_00165 [Cyanobacteria bacterium P01_F01_bin.3]
MLFEVVGDVETFHSTADSLSQILGYPSPIKVTESYLNSATPHRLRQHRLTQEIPVVFLTATPSLLEPLHAAELGVRGIVAKPFEPETLASQLADVFGWHHARKGESSTKFYHD